MANLHAANLREADLSVANLKVADLSSADIRGAILDGTIFDMTILDKTKRRGGLWNHSSQAASSARARSLLHSYFSYSHLLHKNTFPQVYGILYTS